MSGPGVNLGVPLAFQASVFLFVKWGDWVCSGWVTNAGAHLAGRMREGVRGPGGRCTTS